MFGEKTGGEWGCGLQQSISGIFWSDDTKKNDARIWESNEPFNKQYPAGISTSNQRRKSIEKRKNILTPVTIKILMFNVESTSIFQQFFYSVSKKHWKIVVVRRSTLQFWLCPLGYQYEVYRVIKGKLIIDSDVTTTPIAFIIFTRYYLFSMFYWFKTIENLLWKIYIEGALKRRICNIV